MKPLVFDTSAAFGARGVRRLRDVFPTRTFFLPTLVITERVRQLRVEHGEGFDPELIDQFLDNEYLDLEIVPFGRDAGQRLAELAATFGNNWKPVWPEYQRNVAIHPCGERCRLVDHAVTAIALATGSVLVTSDQRVIDDCRSAPDRYPEAKKPEELLG